MLCVMKSTMIISVRVVIQLNKSLIDFFKYSLITWYSMIDTSLYVNNKCALWNSTLVLHLLLLWLSTSKYKVSWKLMSELNKQRPGSSNYCGESLPTETQRTVLLWARFNEYNYVYMYSKSLLKVSSDLNIFVANMLHYY